MTWLHSPEINPLDYEGFVYLITNNVTGKAYVGRKYIYRFSKGKIVGESDWRTYWGSCKPLIADIKELGAENFTREILRFCITKADTNFAETEEQFKREVLTACLSNGDRAYYNNNIMSRYFARSPESYEAAREKQSAGIRRYHANNVHPMKGKQHPNKGKNFVTSRTTNIVAKAGFNSIEELVARVVELHDQGLIQRDIATSIGITRHAVRRYLKRGLA